MRPSATSLMVREHRAIDTADDEVRPRRESRQGQCAIPPELLAAPTFF